MRWLIRTRKPAAKALNFCKEFLQRYDPSQLRSIKLDKGITPYGVYGWGDESPEHPWEPYNIVLHLPGPFPCKISTREAEAYSGKDRIKTSRGVVFSVRYLNNRSEGLVWLFGHEIFHYLASTKQIDFKNTERNADHFGSSILDEYRDV